MAPFLLLNIFAVKRVWSKEVVGDVESSSCTISTSSSTTIVTGVVELCTSAPSKDVLGDVEGHEDGGAL